MTLLLLLLALAVLVLGIAIGAALGRNAERRQAALRESAVDRASDLPPRALAQPVRDEAAVEPEDAPASGTESAPQALPGQPSDHPRTTSDQATAPPRDIYTLARDLAPFFDETAHPAQLLESPVFNTGVEQLASMPLDQALNFATGANPYLASMAAAALAARDDSASAVPRMLDVLRAASPWTIYFALDYLARHARSPIVGALLVRAHERWANHPLMPTLVSDFIDRRVDDGEIIDLAGAIHPDTDIAILELLIDRLATRHVSTLRSEIAHWRATRVDHKFLREVGKLFEPSVSAIEHEVLAAGVAAGFDSVTKSPPRSFIISGQAGVGKSTLARAIATRLAAAGWTILEASATDINAGMTYVGELEGRIRRLLDAIDVRRRVVWYAPAMHELLYAGRHRSNPVGILDMILPAVEAGRIIMIGEVTPAALEAVVRERPRVRGAFDSLALEPLDLAESAALGVAYVDRFLRPAGIDAAEDLVPEALELARHYLGSLALPGSLLDLLRLAHAQAGKAGNPRLTRDTLLATLTGLTGLPASVLDDRAELDPQGLRAHFAKHVMGQPEAVDCLVDRVAMLKAGLTDPERPVGVFLFAGPTGTGKTEVARTLAAFLFGNADRMIRLDMSEFQESGSLVRILGATDDAGESESLASRIRKQPFSVVLLDEFEKSHPRIWDLFLQVFDAGRLTDAQGAMADFRHAIIILTSNLGATAHQGSSLGFRDAASPFSAAQVTRAITQTFRPEFVNRLDRVVVFRPLSRGVMRDILRKELAAVLKRRGFRNRDWAVEWEDSAIEFLLDRGFTADMGARPLRRAIEEHVLAPIAMTIVERAHPEGDQFLFVRSDGAGIQVQFIDPDEPEPSDASWPQGRLASAPEGEPASLALGPLARSASGSADEVRFLIEQVQMLEERVGGELWLEEKTVLAGRMNQPGFWESADRFGVIDRIERIDHIEAAAATARSLAARLTGHRGHGTRTVITRLAGQLHVLLAALADLDGDRPSDVYLLVEAVTDEGDARARDAWLRRLTSMYQRWAQARRVRCTLLALETGSALLGMSGIGAHHLLADEAGLHVFEFPAATGGPARATARVRVAGQPVTPRPRERSEADHARACFDGKAEPVVVRRYREQPSPLVRDSVAGWRTGRFTQVLEGEFDLMRG